VDHIPGAVLAFAGSAQTHGASKPGQLIRRRLQILYLTNGFEIRAADRTAAKTEPEGGPQ